MITLEKSWKDIYTTKNSTAALLQTIPGPMANEFTALLQKQSGGTILDLGCGYGNYLPYLSKLGVSVIGSDLSIEALTVARRRMKKQDQVDIPLILHDMQNLPFCDESIDGLLSINTIHHGTMDEVKRVVSEIHRVLKKGKVGLVTLLADTDFKFDRARVTGEKTLRVESGAETGIVHSFFNQRDIHALLTNFELLQIEKDDRRVRDLLSSHWVILFRKMSPNS